MNPGRLARLAGLLYLLLAVTSGPAQFFRESLLVAGDSTATAAKVRDSLDPLRLALVADLVGVAAWVGLALALYFLFREVGSWASASFLVLVGVGAAVMAADLFNHAAAIILATGPAFAGSDRMISLAVELHRQGIMVAGVFFGLWMIPLGIVVWRSGWVPRLLGVALVVGGMCYLVALVPVYASPVLDDGGLNTAIAMPAGIAELAFAVWLTAVGLNERGRTFAGSRALALAPAS